MGYGLRYEYGIFRQAIENGFQVEHPDHWLAQPDPWEVARPRETVQVPLGCSFRLENGVLRAVPGHADAICSACPTTGRSSAMAAGRSTRCGCGERRRPTSSTSASSAPATSSGRSSTGSLAETVTRVLYPDDSTVAGQALRFVQEYFLVCCSLADIVARFRRTNDDWQSSCPTRSPSSSTTRIRRWPWPS